MRVFSRHLALIVAYVRACVFDTTSYYVLGYHGFIGSCARFMKNSLASMIDKTLFVSQQPFKGADHEYPLWLEKVCCSAQAFSAF
jgi:hypothetical protein